ncbi:hypothetical protein [Nisaea sp.]|uniref:hypothetical protein n=1 Tax=Nisaea sp. TaxID=2024842 RepID=UPI0032EF465D
MLDHAIVEAFRESMIGLMKLLNEETALLKKREFKTLDKLQARKRQLSITYDKHQTAMRNHPEVLDDVPDDERAELRDLYQRFRCALSDNMLALRSSHDAAERVVSLIMESVRKQRGINADTPTFGKTRTGYAAYAPLAQPTAAVSKSL